ncbi:hypothetical protein I4U23_008208 [Adineta vaga]|nr:hypothetical protein I4U23_008208 [Adineta vaga]
MYFSIPDTTEISAKRSTEQYAYTLYNIHINGLHHCSLRYSQLRIFNAELQRILPNLMQHIQPFPPKKLFRLSSRDIEERQMLLERYLQSIIQHKSLICSSYFNEFFFNAQRETYLNALADRTIPDKINFTVYFLNNHEIIIENLSLHDTLSKLFELCANNIQLTHEYFSYFALFLYKFHDNQLNLIRPLFSFESPYISLKQAQKLNETSCLVLKKSYWDVTYDLKLLDNPCTQNLLFLQCQYDIQQSEEFDSDDIHKQLNILRDNKQFKDYILLARTSTFSGYLFLRQCTIHDVTNENMSPCLLAIGNNELICYYLNEEKKNSFLKEINFKVTRIRCWKVNWTKSDLNITFEYLVRKNTLQWVTIHTVQAALVSTCLQSMVDEILMKRIDSSELIVHETMKNDRSKTNGSLATRTKSDLERLNNNELFDKGGDDDDL